MKKFKLTALLLLSLGLTACGGGSGGSDSTASTNNEGGLDEVMDLDRCIEQALFNGATTGAEALSICTGVNDNPSTDGGDIATPKYQSVLVKGIRMKPATEILNYNITSNSIITALMICDNSVVTPNTFDNNEIKKSSILNEWRGDKQYAGYYKVSVDGRDDNCLVQATNYNSSFPQGFYSEETNTIYRKGKVAHIDMISTLAMAREMGTRSYTIIEDILEGQDRSRHIFPYGMNKGHFEQYRTELPSNESYEAAEKAIIDEIKATPQYAEAAGVIDGIIADIFSTDELLDAYNNLAERAKLLAALYEIKEGCGEKHGVYSDTCSTGNIITLYSEGNDLKTAFSL